MTKAVNLANVGNSTNVDSSGNLQFNSGYGSVATAYGCRAWVNFNGRNTVSIRASGNVSSITDNGVGDYTINFTAALPDANYSIALTCGGDTGNTTDGNIAVGGLSRNAGTQYSQTGTRVQTTVISEGSAGRFWDQERVLFHAFR